MAKGEAAIVERVREVSSRLKSEQKTKRSEEVTHTEICGQVFRK